MIFIDEIDEGITRIEEFSVPISICVPLSSSMNVCARPPSNPGDQLNDAVMKSRYKTRRSVGRSGRERSTSSISSRFTPS